MSTQTRVPRLLWLNNNIGSLHQMVVVWQEEIMFYNQELVNLVKLQNTLNVELFWVDLNNNPKLTLGLKEMTKPFWGTNTDFLIPNKIIFLGLHLV